MTLKQKQLLLTIDSFLIEYEYYKSTVNLNLYEKKLNKDVILKDYIFKYNIPVRCLYSILSYIRNRIAINDLQGIEKFLITRIITEPQNFITPEEVLIPFEIIEKICSQNDIAVSPICWANNYFLVVRKNLYIPTTLLRKDAIAYFKSIYFYDKLFVSYKNIYSTTPYYLQLEKDLSTQFLRLFEDDSESFKDATPSEIATFIDDYEKKKNVRFNDLQREAIAKCILKRTHVICGFPGTGKSTIFDVVKEFYYSIYETKAYNIACLAPTGLAIKNLIKKCKVVSPEICGTIHRMAFNINHYMISNYIDDISIIKQKTEPNMLSPMDRFILKRHSKIVKYKTLIPNMIVIDEFSMVDIIQLKWIIRFCELYQCKLIIMGDENQLPPIGPGNPLYTMTNCIYLRKLHITFLMDIMRQDKKLLIDNIKKIKEKEYLIEKQDFDDKTMIMLNYNNFLDTSKQICNEKIVDFIVKNNLTKGDTQFLSPENHKNCGCVYLNKVLQDFYNPRTSQNSIIRSNFRLRDLVVRTQNCLMDERGIFANGDTGLIKELKKEMVVIEYDNGELQDVTISELHDEFALRYCLTIHKSQGGEYVNVVLIMGTPHEITSWRQSHSNKLLYTAVSRAKSKCFIIAKPNIINICQSIEEFPIETTFLNDTDVFDTLNV
jgi:hypothetical protein